MPRKPRLFKANMPFLVQQTTSRGNLSFIDDSDYQYFLVLLRNALARYQLALHAFVLLDNSFKLLLTPSTQTGISQMAQMLSSKYSKYFNKKYNTKGRMWPDRYKASHVEESNYILGCMRYLESLPVANGLVNHPEQYQWSSYRDNVNRLSFLERIQIAADRAQKQANQINEPDYQEFYDKESSRSPFISEHQNFKLLGGGMIDHKTCYSELFFMEQNKVDFTFFGDRIKHSFPIGSADFVKHIEQMFKVRFTQVKPGRPVKKA